MRYFENFVSNTYAGSGNQFVFKCDEDVCVGRIFYKIAVGGKYNYSLLFSNITDSTYADGSISKRNLICDEWDIHSASIACVRGCELSGDFTESDVADSINIGIKNFRAVTFNGERHKRVAPGEFFATDPMELEFDKGDYLCLEISFSGDRIPYHEESLLPVFRKTENGWVYDRRMPFPGMIGCDRKVKARVGFIGDSITQGIGTQLNSYKHWNALVAEKLGDKYAYWNMGIGYARADDMATEGAWMFKARNNDIVFVCYGVNDIYNGYSADEIINNLNKIVFKLKNEGKKIILQTVPPFDYEGENIEKWNKVNRYILTEMKDKVELVFYNVPYLGESPEKPYSAQKYGGHPNEEGCSIWADALYNAVKGII